MSFRSLFQQLGFWTTILSWQEPAGYRVALKGDWLPRLLLAVGIGCVPMALLLVLFAINVNPPHPAFSLIGFLIGATMAGLVLFRGEATAAGSVRICQEGIIRKRQFTPLVPVHFGFEEANWPYDAFTRAILVPGQQIGQSFSVLLLTDERNIEIVGVPGKISPHELAQTLAGRGVRVEAGAFLPEMYTRPLAWPIAGVAGGLGLMLAVFSLGFYGVKALGGGGAGGPARNQVAQAQPDLPRAGFPPPVQPQRQIAPSPPENQAGIIAAPPPAEASSIPLSPFGAPSGIPTLPEVPTAGSRSGASPDPFAGNPFAGNPFASPPAAGVVVGSQAGVPRAAGSDEFVGGKGGFPFKAASPDGKAVVGVRYGVGAWAGKQALSQLDPVYDRAATRGSGTLLLAREGYVVGGLIVEGAELVQAVQIEFTRQKPDGTLDPADTYTSDWLGAPAGGASNKLSGGNRRVIGIQGRRGAVIDALGLVLEE
jgi:hypothetical protein